MALSKLFAEIQASKYLFLTEMGEPQANALRIVVAEGQTSEHTSPLHVGGTVLHAYPVDVDETSRAFEFLWKKYVAFLVLNESYGTLSRPDEIFEGNKVRLYSKSRLLDHIKGTSIASDEYPGPLLHFEVICEFHVVEVISTEPPDFRRVSPLETVQ